MDGGTLTVVVGVAGILFSLLFSVLFYRRGVRVSREEKADLRRWISNMYHESAERFQAKREVRPILVQAGEDHSTIADHLGVDVSNSAAEALVRASLGALVNARGEVSLPRLIREVSQVSGAPKLPEVVEILGGLRAEGVIDWDGDLTDPSGPRTLRARAGRSFNTLSTTKLGVVGLGSLKGPVA